MHHLLSKDRAHCQTGIDHLKQRREKKRRSNLEGISTHVCYVSMMSMLNFQEFLTKSPLAEKLGSLPMEATGI